MLYLEGVVLPASILDKFLPHEVTEETFKESLLIFFESPGGSSPGRCGVSKGWAPVIKKEKRVSRSSATWGSQEARACKDIQFYIYISRTCCVLGL